MVNARPAVEHDRVVVVQLTGSDQLLDHVVVVLDLVFHQFRPEAVEGVRIVAVDDHLDGAAHEPAPIVR